MTEYHTQPHQDPTVDGIMTAARQGMPCYAASEITAARIAAMVAILNLRRARQTRDWFMHGRRPGP